MDTLTSKSAAEYSDFHLFTATATAKLAPATEIGSFLPRA